MLPIRKYLLVAVLMLLPSPAIAKVGGDTDKVPVPATAYTVICVPDNFDLAVFSTDPELVSLRKLTDFTVYHPDNPDFKHRWAERLPQVRQGKIALIVEQDGKKICGIAGESLNEVCAQVRYEGVVAKLKSNGCRPFVCPNCQPHHPKQEPEEPREPEIVRLPPLIEDKTTSVVEKVVENNSLPLLGMLAAGALPIAVCVGIGSYFVTRNIDEEDSLQ